MTVLVVNFGCGHSNFIREVDSLVKSSLHFGAALINAAAHSDGISVFLGFVHLEIFSELSDHEYLLVFEVLASEGDVELSLDLVLSVDTGLSFVVLVFPEYGRRSILRDDEVEAEIVVSISQETTLPVCNSLMSADKSMLLLLLILHSLLVFTFAFVAEGVELNLLLALKR